VIPYYERFLERFPDVQALAKRRKKKSASLVRTRLLRRARNLHKAAQQIMAKHEDNFQ